MVATDPLLEASRQSSDPRDQLRPIREATAVSQEQFRDEIVDAREPVVMRGLVSAWPMVEAPIAALRSAHPDAVVETFVGPPQMKGRFFYDDDVTGFNFQRVRVPFRAVLDTLAEQDRKPAPPMYMGSTPADEIVPGFRASHLMPLLRPEVAPRIWIGNRSVVAPHFDETDNIACVVAGRRRFTLFPPEQVANLYVGPLDNTMAGQPASMVDVANPDLGRYPRFAQALQHGATAELGPGDAIYIPPVWWHHVEALSDFNVLVNYWWQHGPADAGTPFAALAHSLMTIAHLPPQTRTAWRSLFDQFVFQMDGDPAAHLPAASRGILAPSTPELRARIRQFLLRVLGSR
jgi:hypothetical protein